MNFIKANWILLLILVLSIYLLYRYYRKTKDEVGTVANTVSNKISSYTAGISNVNVNTPVENNTTVPVSNVNFNVSDFKVGDNLFAGQGGVNGYKTALIASGNVYKFYNPTELIGTYLGIDGNFIKIIVTEKGYLYDSYPQVFVPNNKQVYKKNF